MLEPLNGLLASDAPAPVLGLDKASELWRIAEVNGVVLSLARRILRDPPDAWPDAIRTASRQAMHFCLSRNLTLIDLMNRIGREFDHSGIGWIALKGPVFSAQYYGDLTARASRDLDLLVFPESVPEAVRALARLGVIPSRPIRHNVRRFGVQPHEYNFLSRSPRFLVELHSSLSSACYAIVPVETVFQRKQTFDLDGVTYPVMSAEDTLLFACLHGFGHRWEHLSQIYHVDRVLRRTAPDLDWVYIVRRMQAARKQRAVLLALSLGRHCFGTPLPDAIQRLCAGDDTLPPLQACVLRRLGKPRSQIPARSILQFKLRVLESARDRLGLLGRTCARCVDAVTRRTL